MPLVISDESLANAGLTEADARIEFACGLFDSGRLHLWPAAQLAGLSRADFEAECGARNIAVYRFDVGDIDRDYVPAPIVPRR